MLKTEKSAMGEILTDSLDYVSLWQTTKFPKFIYELSFANGRTLQNISRHDLEQNIIDNSLSFGLGLPTNWINPASGHIDLMAHISVSRYAGEGNGWAATPLADLSYTTPEFMSTLAFYGGFGLGLGKDTMQLQGYSNEYKWTIDFFAGIQYAMLNNLYLRIGPLLRHKSHSFVGPWEVHGSNIGYNGLMVQATMRAINP